jgi:mannosyl-oligosaccharide glucosidase
MLLLNPLAVVVAGYALTANAAEADDASILYQETARQQNESLLWGPYRPNLYFGVRPRIPKSFMGGLMWSTVDNFQDVQNSKCCRTLPRLVYRPGTREMRSI